MNNAVCSIIGRILIFQETQLNSLDVDDLLAFSQNDDGDDEHGMHDEFGELDGIEKMADTRPYGGPNRQTSRRQ